MKLLSKEKADKAKDGTGKAWGGTKAAFGRTRQKVLAATGRAEQTVDLEFEYLDDTFTYHRHLLDELTDDAKAYLKAAEDFAVTQRKLADEILELYEASAPMYNAGLAYQSGAIEIEKHMKKLKEGFKKEFQDPLETYLAQYDELAKRMDIRDTRRVDMDRFFREYLSALEAPGHDPRRVIAKKDTYETALSAYQSLNTELLQDMKELYKDRLKFLTPLFARLVVVQSELLGEAQTMLKNVASVLPRRPATAPDVHRLGSVITDEDTTAANGGTDYAAFEGAAGGGGELAAASDDEDSGEARAEALLAAAQTTGAGRTLEQQQQQQQKKPKAALPVPTPGPKLAPKSPRKVTADALYDFAGDDDDELPFKKGDVLTILEQDGDWWEAELRGKKGSIPANYVKIK